MAFLIGRASTYDEALFLWKITGMVVASIPTLLYHTVWLMCDIKKKRLLFFAYIQWIFFSIIGFTDIVVSGVVKKFSSFYYAQPGKLFFLFTISWVFLFIYSNSILYKTYRQSTGIKRKHFKYFFFGVTLLLVGGIQNYFPIFNIDIYPYSNILLPVYLIVITYGIFKYRLLDITIVLTRFILFIIFYLIVGCFLFLFLYWKKNLIFQYINNEWFLFSFFFVSFLLATAINFIYMVLQNKAENRILITQRRQHRMLLQVSKDMTLIKEIDKLLDLIVQSITQSVDISYCAIYIIENDRFYNLVAQRPELVNSNLTLDKNETLIHTISSSNHALLKEELEIRGEAEESIKLLEEINASVIIPAFLKEKLLGFLIIGRKNSGLPYSMDDLDILMTLANHAALAIENAMFFTELEKTQATLFQTAKMSSLGTLASGMGHQINNRLQAIRLIVESLKTLYSEQIDDAGKSLIKMGLENIDQAKNIIESLREHARPSSKDYETLSFKSILDKSFDMVKLKKGNNFDRINVNINFGINDEKVIGNMAQLQEVFFNLLDNADDAIEEAIRLLHKDNHYVPTINISTSQMNNNEHYLRIIVEDNGIGISDENLQKLFVPFHTTKATSKKGTGLGLYVIERIIKGHGGSIKVESKYGVGTKFIIDLKKA